MPPEPLPMDRAGQRAFPILLVSVALVVMLLGGRHAPRQPPGAWAAWTVLLYGGLPLATALLLDGWRKPAARAWGLLGLAAVLLPVGAALAVHGVMPAFKANPAWLVALAVLSAGLVLIGAWLGGVDLRRWGFGLGDWRWWAPRAGLLLLGTLLLVALWVWLDPAMRAYYPSDEAAKASAGALALYCGALTLYMVGWEAFWRGYLLFGVARSVGPLQAALFQALPFYLVHRGKPETEMIASFVGGILLCLFCWRGRSLWPAVLLHAFLNAAVQVAGYLA
ncbi:MAG: CPBP family intramembrane glutamic endopeptidase [Pseudomonadota bacterium]